MREQFLDLSPGAQVRRQLVVVAAETADAFAGSPIIAGMPGHRSHRMPGVLEFGAQPSPDDP
jgi:hypothetical protein